MSNFISVVWQHWWLCIPTALVISFIVGGNFFPFSKSRYSYLKPRQEWGYVKSVAFTLQDGSDMVDFVISSREEGYMVAIKGTHEVKSVLLDDEDLFRVLEVGDKVLLRLQDVYLENAFLYTEIVSLSHPEYDDIEWSCDKVVQVEFT